MHDYAAGFRFSPDSQLLVRMQKTGAGYATLYLYQRHGFNFREATKKPLDALAWDYYENVRRKLKLPEPTDHVSADLVKGYDENYRWFGYHWPTGRYIIIGLSSGSMERKKIFAPPDLEVRRIKAAQKNKPTALHPHNDFQCPLMI